MVTTQEVQALQARVQELEGLLAAAQKPCGHEEEAIRLREEAERRISSAREVDRQRYEVLKQELRECRKEAQAQRTRDARRILELETILNKLPPEVVDRLKTAHVRVITF